MATRIGTYGANQLYISRILATQERIHNEQLQVSTKKKAQAYSGISKDSNRLINLENERQIANQFKKNNVFATTKLEAAQTTIKAVQTTIENFKKQLDTFASGNTKDQTKIAEIQGWAFQAMVDIQSYLSTSVDGQYIFSGGRVSQEPVNLPASSLAGFQAIYDGYDVRAQTTRSAHLQEISLTDAHTGDLTFNPANGTITAANSGAFSGIKAGSRITVGGAATPDRSFTVSSVDSTGTTVTVSRLTSEAAASGVTIKWNDNNSSLDNVTTGNLTFSPAGDKITAATAGGFANLPVGTVFTVSGSTSNDGVYEVLYKDSTNSEITIKNTKLDFVVATSTEAAANLTDGTDTMTNTLTNGAAGGYGTLTFGANSSGNLTITSATAGAFTGVYAAGDTLTVAGATTSENNGTYRVISTTGTTLTVSRAMAGGASWTVAENTTTGNDGITFTTDSWYKGDTIGLQHRVDTDRTVDLGIYASDPAFEKALRAMGVIAQGVYGTAGGLENNQSRISAARFLLADSLQWPAEGTAPYGTEESNDIESLASQIGVTQSIIKIKNDKHRDFMAFLDTRIADLENADLTQAVAMLTSDKTALEAGYQALAKVREFSLMDFL